MLKIARAGTKKAEAVLARIAARLDALDAGSPRRTVETIIAAVRRRGDRALFACARKYDGARLNAGNVRVSREELAAAHRDADPALLRAVRRAAANIRRHQKRLLPPNAPLEGRGGVRLGARFVPVARAACMIPSGEAPLFSCVLHNAVPAQVAGVGQIVLASPCGADHRVHPSLLAAAHEIGITEYYRVGGAHAVAALALGTDSIPKVDLIAGPGSIYVTLAKRALYGQVQVDLLAGPSEVLVLADASADPEHVAADLLAQAEHDVLASAILVTTSAPLAKKVQAAVRRRLKTLPRRAVASKSIERYGVALVARSVRAAIDLANRIAPEHLEVMLKSPRKHLDAIRNAGAVFLGPHTPEPVGDYVAGPSHTLPTGGTARSFSGLSAANFVRRVSVIECSRAGLARLRADTVRMARAEQLEAHARSVEARFES